MSGQQHGPLGALWPPGRVEPDEWRELLETLAVDAEKMIGRPTSLETCAALAMRWASLAWCSFSPETIAASCRASLLLNEPVVAARGLSDQLAEIGERLDSIYEAAQGQPEQLAVRVPMPYLAAPPGTLPEPAPPKRAGRRTRQPAPEPAEPA
jgi:hypothetical protein